MTTQLPLPLSPPAPTLHEALAARGLTTAEASGVYRKHVLRGGVVVCTGTAGEVWEWLRGEP